MGPKLAPLAPLAPLKGKGAVGAPVGAVSEARAREVFDQLDINKDGKLQKDELRTGLWKMSVGGTDASIDSCAPTRNHAPLRTYRWALCARARALPFACVASAA